MVRYWLNKCDRTTVSKHIWILLIYNRKAWPIALNAQMHGNSGCKFMDIKRQKTFACLAGGNKQVQRQREKETQRDRQMNSMFSAVRSDIRLSGFKHQHIKFRCVSSSYLWNSALFSSLFCSFVLSKSHAPSPISACKHTDVLGFWSKYFARLA